MTLPPIETYPPHNYRPGPRTISEIVIHHWGSDGQDFGTVARYLASANARDVSIHWVAQGADANGTPRPRVARVVPERDVAFHAGDWAANVRAVGIECRPEARDADYAVVGALVADIRRRHGDLPLRPHKRYVSTACPGRWDLARIDRIARDKDDDMPTAAEIADAVWARKPWAGLGGVPDSTAANNLGWQSHWAEQTLAIVKGIAAKVGADPVDEAELAQQLAPALLAGLEPKVAEAVRDAVAAGVPAEQLAEAVVARMGAALAGGVPGE